MVILSGHKYYSFNYLKEKTPISDWDFVGLFIPVFRLMVILWSFEDFIFLIIYFLNKFLKWAFYEFLLYASIYTVFTSYSPLMILI